MTESEFHLLQQQMSSNDRGPSTRPRKIGAISLRMTNKNQDDKQKSGITNRDQDVRSWLLRALRVSVVNFTQTASPKTPADQTLARGPAIAGS